MNLPKGEIRLWLYLSEPLAQKIGLRLGVGRTFQLVSVFPRLSALENLLTFLQQHQEESVLARLVVPAIRDC